MAIVKIKVRRLTNYIGAEVSGLDLSKGLTRDDAAFLRQTWIDNAVLVIPGQELPPKQFAAFAQIFGEILPPPIAKFSVEDCPELGTISSKDLPVIDGKLHVRGEKFHTDYSNFKEPPKATMLHAIAVPERGGDTQFVDALQPDDLVFWDNRTLVHKRDDVPPDMDRVLWHTIVEGEVPIPWIPAAAVSQTRSAAV